MLFVHPIEHRQVNCFRVDEFRRVTAGGQSCHDEPSQANALPIRSIGTGENENSIGHSALYWCSLATAICPCRASMLIGYAVVGVGELQRLLFVGQCLDRPAAAQRAY